MRKEAGPKFCCKDCGGSEFVDHRDGICVKVLICRLRNQSQAGYCMYLRRLRRESFAKTCERNGIYYRTCWKCLGSAWTHFVEENEGLVTVEECLAILSSNEKDENE